MPFNYATKCYCGRWERGGHLQYDYDTISVEEQDTCISYNFFIINKFFNKWQNHFF
ncbi:MAG: hypothetical protein RIR11_1345 [Bacteroidota bacterium]